MKEIKLTIDGKEVALTAEQIKALGIDVDDGCVCDRVDDGCRFYSVSSNGSVVDDIERDLPLDKKIFEYGNYYRDESYAKQIALHQRLNNLLRRYSEQHGGDAEWDGENWHYAIYQDKSRGAIRTEERTSFKYCGDVYFNSREVAQAAIEEVVKPFMEEHPEFVW